MANAATYTVCTDDALPCANGAKGRKQRVKKKKKKNDALARIGTQSPVCYFYFIIDTVQRADTKPASGARSHAYLCASLIALKLVTNNLLYYRGFPEYLERNYL